MYSKEVKEIMEQFYLSKDYSTWDKYSKDRFKFDVIVRFCNQGISKFIEIVIDVISKCTEPEKDPELRFDMLDLLDFVIASPETQTCLKDNGDKILSRIFSNALIWRSGKPNIKIRKTAVLCLGKMLKAGLFTSEDFYKNYEDLFACLKNCTTDDWAPDLRFASTKLMGDIIELIKNDLTDIQLSNLYPVLLQRLEDAQNPIRIQVAETLKIFLQCKNVSINFLIFYVYIFC